jgi:hypothetical protein
VGPGWAVGHGEAQKNGRGAGALGHNDQGVPVVFEDIVAVGGKGDLPFLEGSWVGFHKPEVPAGCVSGLTVAAVEMSSKKMDANGRRED